MEIVKNVPELDMVARGILSAGFQSMNAAVLTLDTVEGKTTLHPALTWNIPTYDSSHDQNP